MNLTPLQPEAELNRNERVTSSPDGLTARKTVFSSGQLIAYHALCE
jgi:hypothetical protein